MYLDTILFATILIALDAKLVVFASPGTGNIMHHLFH